MKFMALREENFVRRLAERFLLLQDVVGNRQIEQLLYLDEKFQIFWSTLLLRKCALWDAGCAEFPEWIITYVEIQNIGVCDRKLRQLVRSALCVLSLREESRRK